jgi:hypothetical protein
MKDNIPHCVNKREMQKEIKKIIKNGANRRENVVINCKHKYV